MSALDFAILSLAVWRLSSLLVEEEGPCCVFARLRHLAGVREDENGNTYGVNEIGYALSCIWCTTLWVGLAWFAFWLAAPTLAVCAATPLALTAVGIVVHGRGIRYRKR